MDKTVFMRCAKKTTQLFRSFGTDSKVKSPINQSFVIQSRSDMLFKEILKVYSFHGVHYMAEVCAKDIFSKHKKFTNAN